MTGLDEQLLERFVRYPDTLSTDDHDLALALLATSPLARELASFYRDYYEELDLLMAPPAPSVVRYHA